MFLLVSNSVVTRQLTSPALVMVHEPVVVLTEPGRVFEGMGCKGWEFLLANLHYFYKVQKKEADDGAAADDGKRWRE